MAKWSRNEFMLVIACSRPKQLLAFPSTTADANSLRKFGTNIEIITL